MSCFLSFLCNNNVSEAVRFIGRFSMYYFLVVNEMCEEVPPLLRSTLLFYMLSTEKPPKMVKSNICNLKPENFVIQIRLPTVKISIFFKKRMVVLSSIASRQNRRTFSCVLFWSAFAREIFVGFVIVYQKACKNWK